MRITARRIAWFNFAVLVSVMSSSHALTAQDERLWSGLQIVYPGQIDCVSGVCPYDLYIFDPETEVTNQLPGGYLPDVIGTEVSSNGDILYRVLEGTFIVKRGNLSQPRLILHPDYTGYRSWSPDGSRFALNKVEDNYQNNLYLVELNGDISQLTDDLIVWGSPSWSADASRIAIEGRINAFEPQSAQIYVLNLEANQLSKLTSGNGFAFFPQWAPNPNMDVISYLHVRDDKTNIEILDLSSQAQQTIDNGIGPRWVMDGQGLLYTSKTPENFNSVFLYDLVSGTHSLVLSGEIRDVQIARYGLDVSPDGFRLVYRYNDSNNDWGICAYHLGTQEEECFGDLGMYPDGIPKWLPLHSN